MEAWITKTIGDVINKTPTTDPRKKPCEKFLYVDVSGVSNTALEITEANELTGKEAPSRARRIINEGDVIFATVRPTLKRIAVVPKRLDGQVCSTGYFVFQPKEELYNRYLFYFLQTDYFMGEMEKLQSGASYPAVNDTQVKSTLISYPSLPEQKRIVAILDKAFAAIDEAKAKTEQNLKNARELFESEKAEAFGKLSNKFCEKKISEVCEEIFAGGDAPKHSLSKIKTDKYKIPIYANAVKDQGLYGFTEKARVLKPSVTVAARGSGTGHVEVRKAEFLPIVRLIVLTPTPDKMNVDFLYYAIKNLDILRSGSAIPQLTVPMMRSYSIPVPDISTQVEIVHRFRKSKSHIDSLIKNYNSKLELLGELKKSLLQKAFSGELTAKQAEEAVA